MRKILFIATMSLILAVSANAKILKLTGTYLGTECGEMCHMSFKTAKGEVSITGDGEQYKNLKVGKSYTVTYEEKMEYFESAQSKIPMQYIKNIK